MICTVLEPRIHSIQVFEWAIYVPLRLVRRQAQHSLSGEWLIYTSALARQHRGRLGLGCSLVEFLFLPIQLWPRLSIRSCQCIVAIYKVAMLSLLTSR